MDHLDKVSERKEHFEFEAPVETSAAAKTAGSIKLSPFAHFTESIQKFEYKGKSLPKQLRPHISAIALHGRNIIAYMETDPADVQPGTRFLERYLPASHKIVDEYIRLEREGREYNHVETVLGRADEMLQRLAHAFQEEHGSLLRNDTMQLSAELEVLDKLLKMEGR